MRSIALLLVLILTGCLAASGPEASGLLIPALHSDVVINDQLGAEEWADALAFDGAFRIEAQGPADGVYPFTYLAAH